MLKTDTGLLRVKREDGTRVASVRNFHSFRVTWVTIALAAVGLGVGLAAPRPQRSLTERRQGFSGMAARGLRGLGGKGGG